MSVVNDSRSHSETEYRDLICEYQSLQRKFDAKVEALLAVSQELASCQVERDHYKAQAADYVDRSRALKSALLAQKKERNRKESAADEQHQHLLDLLNRINEENRDLQNELDRSRAEVEEARGDNKLLRQQLAKHKYGNSISTLLEECENVENGKTHSDGLLPFRNEMKTQNQVATASNAPKLIIDDFEKLKAEHSQLERDLKSMLCEKEELVIERDAFKNKTERLNREINYILNGDDRRIIADVDQLIAENRFLKEQLQHAREENGLRKAELSKYKSCLEKRKPILKSAFSIPNSRSCDDHQSASSSLATSSKGSNGMQNASYVTDAAALLNEGLYPFITPKQVRQLLQQPDGKDGTEQPVNFRALAAALSEALNDKNLALSHQRKANKILGTRVTELENRLHAFETTGSGSRSPMRNGNRPQGAIQEDQHMLSVSPLPPSVNEVSTMTEENEICSMATSIDRLKLGVDLTDLSNTSAS